MYLCMFNCLFGSEYVDYAVPCIYPTKNIRVLRADVNQIITLLTMVNLCNTVRLSS